MKRLCVLGSTGSIGTSTLDLVDLYPERFEVAALAARSRVDLIAEQCRRYRPSLIALFEEEAADEVRRLCPGVEVLSGIEGIAQAAVHSEVDIVVGAITGAAGLIPVYRALCAGKSVALANKETLVIAGEIVTRAARQRGVDIVPVDSEHSALHQCLRGARAGDVERLWLTASGGPFFGEPTRDLWRVTVEETLNHPTWDMGPKITVDSATLMNKGLEVIEAHHLFGLSADRISIAVHPQSVVHSMVEFIDGTFLAQMSITDMRSAILYALSDPERCPTRLPRFDPFAIPALRFHPPDFDRFPCLGLAYRALEQGRTYPAVLNAANEVAVERFLQGALPLAAIPSIIESALEKWEGSQADSLEAVLAADREGRRLATSALGTIS